MVEKVKGTDMKWNFNTEKPDANIKIEFVIKGINEIEYGIWDGEKIQCTDKAYRWSAVLYWRYLSGE